MRNGRNYQRKNRLSLRFVGYSSKYIYCTVAGALPIHCYCLILVSYQFESTPDKKLFQTTVCYDRITFLISLFCLFHLLKCKHQLLHIIWKMTSTRVTAQATILIHLIQIRLSSFKTSNSSCIQTWVKYISIHKADQAQSHFTPQVGQQAHLQTKCWSFQESITLTKLGMLLKMPIGVKGCEISHSTLSHFPTVMPTSIQIKAISHLLYCWD